MASPQLQDLVAEAGPDGLHLRCARAWQGGKTDIQKSYHHDLMDFYSELMGFHSDLMGFYGELMGFYSE